MTQYDSTDTVEDTEHSPAEVPVASDQLGTSKRKAKNKIKFEATMQRQEAAIYFRALVDGLENGRLEFRQGDDTLELLPSDTVVVEVKASDKGSKQKVTFELEWRPDAGHLEVNS